MELTHALLLLVLFGLGTARMAAIISIDKITEPLRDLIFYYHPPEDDDANGWFYQSFRKATPEEQLQQDSWDVPWWQKRFVPGDTVRKPTFLGMLIGCHRCVSVWIAFGNLALYWLWQDGAIILNLGCAISFVSSAVDTKYYRKG